MRQCSGCVCLLVAAVGSSSAFLFAPSSYVRQKQNTQATTRSMVMPPLRAQAVFGLDEEPATEQKHVPFFLKPYQDASGQVINPYQVLGVKRSASASEIKRSFYRLCRQFHPDMQQQHKDNLPADIARDQFERVRFAYGILKDHKSRMRYDRCQAWADPGKALGRAALHVVGRSLEDTGKLAIALGGFALEQIGKAAQRLVDDGFQPSSAEAAAVGRLTLDHAGAVDTNPLGWALDTVPYFLENMEDRIQQASSLIDMGKELFGSIAPQFAPTLDW